MSYYSYTTINCSFPKGTPIADDNLYDIRYPKDGDVAYIEWDGETRYADEILYDLNATFGKRIDEVPGLILDLHYSTDEDEHWEFMMLLEDGEWTYYESELVFRKKPVSESYVELDAGSPIGRAKKAWRALGEIPIDDNERIVGNLSSYRSGLMDWYESGTHREDIWHDIEEQTGVSVAYLMGQAKNPDGTN